MNFNTIFFDLDDTLYPPSNGLWLAIRERMDQFMSEKLHLSKEVIPALRHEYFIKFGTTLRGLQFHYQVNPNDFLNYVHDIPVEQLVLPDPELRKLLISLSQSKYIFTNADINHAQRVIKALEISECFHGIIDVKAMNYLCKPDVQAYHIALRIAGEESPERCLYLDDSARNLAPAHKLGIFTILVGETAQQPFAKLSIRRPHELCEHMPELWSKNELITRN